MSKLRDYTEGPIIRSLIQLSVPIVMANVLQTAYQLVDTFWVGRLGKEAVAAVSLSFPIIFLLISLGGGLTIAGTILVAQHRGRKDEKQVSHVVAQTMISMLLISVVISVVGYFISEPILHWMGAEPEVLPDAVSYLHVSFLGMVFMFIYFVYQSLMRGVGNVKTPFFVVLMTVLLNLVLDPLFILGWGPIPAFGVTGAALATIGTQGIAALVGLALLIRGKEGVRLSFRGFRFDYPLIRTMLSLGLPASLSQSTRAFGLTVMSFLVASFGTLTVASYGIGIRVISFIIIPAIGLSMATSTLVGQNLGAEKLDRAEQVARQALRMGVTVLTLLGILVFIFAKIIVTAFIPDDPEVIKSGVAFVRAMALTYGFIGVQQTTIGAFNGAGETKLPLILSLMAFWVFQFPVALILSKYTHLGEWGIWIAFPFSNVMTGSLAYWWFMKGAWKHKKLISKKEKLEEDVLFESIVEEGAS